MLTLKNRRHIRKMRHTKSFRSCPNATGFFIAWSAKGMASPERSDQRKVK